MQDPRQNVRHLETVRLTTTIRTILLLSPAHELDDLDLRSRSDGGMLPIGLPHDLPVHFHRHPFRIDAEPAEQTEHCEPRIDLANLAIQNNFDRLRLIHFGGIGRNQFDTPSRPSL